MARRKPWDPIRRRKRRKLRPHVVEYRKMLMTRASEKAAKNGHALGEWQKAPDVGNVLEAFCLGCGASMYIRVAIVKEDVERFFGPCNYGQCKNTDWKEK